MALTFHFDTNTRRNFWTTSAIYQQNKRNGYPCIQTTTLSSCSRYTEDKQIDLVQHCNRYGYLDIDESTGRELHKYHLNDEDKILIKKERARAQKWAPMILHWQQWTKKKSNKAWQVVIIANITYR